MGVRIGEISSRFELMNWDEPQVGRIRRTFLDQDEALRFVQSQLVSVEAFALVRRWAADHALTHQTDRGFLTLLAAKLMSGEVWVTEQERDLSRLGKGNVKPAPPKPGPGPKPGPKPKPKPVAELLVIVTDLNGKPVEWATVTAGSLGSRTTDKDGKADFGTVTPGTYDVVAVKHGHGKRRNGPEEKDEKKAVSVPDGTKTEVKLIQHPECANVAFFEGPPGQAKRFHYFGFDHKTNLKTTGGHSYWDPVPAKGAVTFADRDETRWVSVAVGQETEVEIHFAFLGPECIPCVANSRFQMADGAKAEVVTAHITAKKAIFKIKGKAAGETTMKVICDGKDIGRLNIWCAVENKFLIDVATVVTARTPAAAYQVAGLTKTLTEIYRQIMRVPDVKDLGTIDLTANAAINGLEASLYTSGNREPDVGWESYVVTLDDEAAHSVAARTSGPSSREGAKRLYFYFPTVFNTPGGRLLGIATDIGGPGAFTFFNDQTERAYNTAAHELGHTISLRHPLHDEGAGQYPQHLLDTLNHACPTHPETNTEPATNIGGAAPNVMAADPANLMGYWPDRPARKYLRYNQWKAADRS